MLGGRSENYDNDYDSRYTILGKLMGLTEASSRTEAVQMTVETYVRRAKLEQLRALRGKLDITGTEQNVQLER